MVFRSPRASSLCVVVLLAACQLLADYRATDHERRSAEPTVTAVEDDTAVRLCRLERAELGSEILSLSSQQNAKGESLAILKQRIRYQCTGPDYFHYTEHYLIPYALNRANNATGTGRWARRRTILPPSNSKKRSILIVGNSHTRQMYQTLLCQYSDQIRSSQTLTIDLGSKENPNNNTAYEDAITVYRMKDESTIYTVANLGFIYSPKWNHHLERFVLGGDSLETLDAIVLGHQNVFERKYRQKQFWKDIFQQAKAHPDLQISPRHHPDGFTLPQLAAVYSGPILYLSMTSPLNDPHYTAVQEYIRQDKSARVNLRTLYGRYHTLQIGPTECSAPNGKSYVAECIINQADFNYQNGHRCVGSQGGEPDLLAWDVIEGLYELL